MDRMRWSQNLAIGHNAIDEQHKRLIELVDAVPDAAGPHDMRLMHELLEYVLRHFAAEEAFMHRIGYPSVAEHVAVHRGLEQTLLSHKARFDSGGLLAPVFKEFVFRWISEHIMVEDKRIGRFLSSKAQGPKQP